MQDKVLREVIVKREIGVNVCGLFGETIEGVFPPGRYALLEGSAVKHDGSKTLIYLIEAGRHDSWLPAWEWLLKAREGIVELVFK